jgi:hypothetical protein
MAMYLHLDLPNWVPPPLTAAKPDIWTSIARLRSPATEEDRGLTAHVSPQATASHLADDDPHP